MKIAIIKIKDDDTYKSIFAGPANIGLFKTMIRVFNATNKKGYAVLFINENNKIVELMTPEEFLLLEE